MKRNQTGEVMLVVMVVMLVFALLGSRHMGHGDNHAEHPAHQDRHMTKDPVSISTESQPFDKNFSK